MNIYKTVLVVLSISLFSTFLYSQDKGKGPLGIDPVKINVNYRELITDDNNVVNRDQNYLAAINKLVRDSILIWAKRYELNKAEGFAKFGTFLGERLSIPISKKIELIFIDNTGNKETYLLWCLGVHRFEFENTPNTKRR